MGSPHTQLTLMPAGVTHTVSSKQHTFTLPKATRVKRVDVKTDEDGNHHITLHEE